MRMIDIIVSCSKYTIIPVRDDVEIEGHIVGVDSLFVLHDEPITLSGGKDHTGSRD